MHPLDISRQRSVPRSDRSSGPSVTQSPLWFSLLVFFCFVYTVTPVKVVIQFILNENWILNTTYYVVLFNFYCWYCFYINLWDAFLYLGQLGSTFTIVLGGALCYNVCKKRQSTLAEKQSRSHWWTQGCIPMYDKNAVKVLSLHAGSLFQFFRPCP